MPGRTHTDAQIEARRGDIEAAIKAGMWSPSIKAALCRKHGVSLKQIVRDHALVLNALLDDLPDDDTSRATFVVELRDMRRRLMASGDGPSAVKSAVLEANIRGFLRPVVIGIQQLPSDPRALARAVVEAYPEAQRLLAEDGTPEVIDVVEVAP